jgi:hypothetical protein
MRSTPHLRRAALARRIAAGLPVWAAARGADMPVEEAEALMREPAFRQMVDSWVDILALDPEARKRRLLSLANDIIDDAIGRGDMRTILLVRRQRLHGEARRHRTGRCRRRPAPAAPVKAVAPPASVRSPQARVDAAPAGLAPPAATPVPAMAVTAGRSAPERPIATLRITPSPEPTTEDRPADRAETAPVASPPCPRPAADSIAADRATIRENLAAALHRKKLRQARGGGRWPGGP